MYQRSAKQPEYRASQALLLKDNQMSMSTTLQSQHDTVRFASVSTTIDFCCDLYDSDEEWSSHLCCCC